MSSTNEKKPKLQNKPKMEEKPKRSVRKKKVAGEKFNPKFVSWNVKEKKALYEALKRFPPTDIDVLQREVKTKSKTEISEYIKRLQVMACRKNRREKTEWTPIEYWLELVKDLTGKESVDYSKGLGRVLSIAGNFEDFPTPSDTVPDYRDIYKYLSALLLNQDLPSLGRLESLVLLDQLHNLVDVLRTHDTSEQFKIMKWKYQMLASKVDMANPAEARVRAKKALENDFSVAQGNVPECTSSVVQQTSTGDQTVVQSSSETTELGMALTNLVQDSKVNVPTKRRKRGRPKKSDETSGTPRHKYFKKPALFTLNPLCIPVNMLKMNSFLKNEEEILSVTEQTASRTHIQSFSQREETTVNDANNTESDIIIVNMEDTSLPSYRPIDRSRWFQAPGIVVPAQTCQPYKAKTNGGTVSSPRNMAPLSSLPRHPPSLSTLPPPSASTSSLPQPSASTSLPPPSASTSLPPPSASTSLPPPSASTSLPPPQPSASFSLPPPQPSARTSLPPPSVSTSLPPPSVGTSSGPDIPCVLEPITITTETRVDDCSLEEQMLAADLMARVTKEFLRQNAR